MYFRHAPKARWQLIEPGVARARSGTPSELPRVKDPVRTLPWASKEQGAVRPDITHKVRVGVGSHRARRRSCSRTPRRARCQSARRTPARSRSADETRWTVAFQKKKAANEKQIDMSVWRRKDTVRGSVRRHPRGVQLRTVHIVVVVRTYSRELQPER